MHIACMISSLIKGGSERVMCNLADYFVQQGHQVTLVTQYRREDEYPLNPKVKRILSQITPEEMGSSRISNFIRRFQKLRNIWKTEKPDAILVFIGKNNFMALLTAWGLHIPVVVSVRADPNQEYPNGWMRFMARHLFKKAVGVVLQTRECMKFFPKAVQRKSVILHNPVNEVFFENPYQGDREHTIVTVGRIDENKNQALLLRAFAQIAENYPDYRIILYGRGDQEENLKQLARNLGLADQITFAGNASDVADQIKKAGVFVLTSNTEGMPNALLEAMVLGLPVIATDCPCGGPRDLIDHGRNGLLTPVRDVNKMKENLQFVLNDSQNAYQMGQNARKTTDIYREKIVYREWMDYLMSVTRKNK